MPHNSRAESAERRTSQSWTPPLRTWEPSSRSWRTCSGPGPSTTKCWGWTWSSKDDESALQDRSAGPHRAASRPCPRATAGRAAATAAAAGSGVGLMTDAGYQPITVSRRIGVPASVIFPILADAGTHREFDGTGMLRGVVSGTHDRRCRGRVRAPASRPGPATGLEERDDGQ